MRREYTLLMDPPVFIGLQNYIWAFTQPEILIVLRNTLIWTIVVPIAYTTIGIAIAYWADVARPGVTGKLAERFAPVDKVLSNAWGLDWL